MHRYIRGLMLAAAAGVVWGCGDDPLAEGAGDNLQLVGDPTALFITVNDLERMVVELKDAQGTAVQTTFAVSNVTAGITVDVDESFVPVFSADGELLPPTSPTRVRLEITAGADPGVESFDVSAGGVTKTFTIRVVPTSFAGTLSGPVVIGAPVTLTATAPFGFAADAEVLSATGISYEVTDIAVDGSTITFIPWSVEPGPLTIDGATLSFISGATFSFETEYADGSASPFTNHDDPDNAAPPIVFPSVVGDSIVIYDGGQIAAFQFYTLSVGTAGTYRFEAYWDTAADYDYAICTLGCGAFINVSGATGANPEIMNQALAVGSYTLYTNLYDAHDEPANFWKLIIKRTL